MKLVKTRPARMATIQGGQKEPWMLSSGSQPLSTVMRASIDKVENNRGTTGSSYVSINPGSESWKKCGFSRGQRIRDLPGPRGLCYGRLCVNLRSVTIGSHRNKLAIGVRNRPWQYSRVITAHKYAEAVQMRGGAGRGGRIIELYAVVCRGPARTGPYAVELRERQAQMQCDWGWSATTPLTGSFGTPHNSKVRHPKVLAVESNLDASIGAISKSGSRLSSCLVFQPSNADCPGANATPS